MTPKIIVTVWKRPFPRDKVRRMIGVGADVLRIKCSHLDIEGILDTFRQARETINEMGTPTALLADLPEAKIRLGDFPTDTVYPEQGKRYVLRYASRSPGLGEFIPVEYPQLGKYVRVDEELLFGDGELAARVHQVVHENEIIIEALNTYPLIRRSGIFCAHLESLDHLTEDVETLCRGLVVYRPEFVAFSFVSSADMLRRAKSFIDKSWAPIVVAKIESRRGVARAAEILEEVDVVMIARGDLALSLPVEELGIVQKELCQRAHAVGKQVIVSTEILDSMESRMLPSRADVCDLTNMVLDGADYVMLCRVAAHAEDPARAVKTAKKIIERVYEYKMSHGHKIT